MALTWNFGGFLSDYFIPLARPLALHLLKSEERCQQFLNQRRCVTYVERMSCVKMKQLNRAIVENEELVELIVLAVTHCMHKFLVLLTFAVYCSFLCIKL